MSVEKPVDLLVDNEVGYESARVEVWDLDADTFMGG